MTTTTQPTLTGSGSTETTGAGATERHNMPRAASRDSGDGARTGVAPLKGNAAQLLQQVLFYAGAVLLPGGLVVIGLGWYGVAHTPYEYNQNAYIVSGGILGLGITFVGGFLYFGSWLARIALDQRESQAQLTEAIRALAGAGGAAEAVAHVHAPVPAQAAAPAAPAPTPAPTPAPAAAAPVAEASDLVVAGRGKTAHRPDCDLIAGREDITAVADMTGLVPCRLCLS